MSWSCILYLCQDEDIPGNPECSGTATVLVESNLHLLRYCAACWKRAEPICRNILAQHNLPPYRIVDEDEAVVLDIMQR